MKYAQIGIAACLLLGCGKSTSSSNDGIKVAGEVITNSDNQPARSAIITDNKCHPLGAGANIYTDGLEITIFNASNTQVGKATITTDTTYGNPTRQDDTSFIVDGCRFTFSTTITDKSSDDAYTVKIGPNGEYGEKLFKKSELDDITISLVG